MHQVMNWMKKYPLTAFFLLTYGISWPLFYVTLFLFPSNMLLQGTLGSIATFAPVFAGMIVSAVSELAPKFKQGWKRPVTFLSSWLLSALVLVLFIWQVRGVQIQPGIMVFSSILALIPAYIISGAFSRIAGVRQYLKSLVMPRGHFFWYLVAFFTFPVIQLTGYAIMQILGFDVGEVARGGFGIGTVVTVVLTFLYGFLFAGGINEESGWRGFAIPRLQACYSPLVASLIVWFFWALWHLLYDIASSDTISSILFNRLVFNLLWSILFVWIFNRTKGSILAPAIFHSAMNAFGEMLPRTDAATVLFALLTLFAVLNDRMWQKISTENNKKNSKG